MYSAILKHLCILEVEVETELNWLECSNTAVSSDEPWVIDSDMYDEWVSRLHVLS